MACQKLGLRCLGGGYVKLGRLKSTQDQDMQEPRMAVKKLVPRRWVFVSSLAFSCLISRLAGPRR